MTRTCLDVTSPALQTQLFWLNASAPTVFGVCTVGCAKGIFMLQLKKKEKKPKKTAQNKTNQQGNVYKM